MLPVLLSTFLNLGDKSAKVKFLLITSLMALHCLKELNLTPFLKENGEEKICKLPHDLDLIVLSLLNFVNLIYFFLEL